jgi:RNA polymerase sigma factor (sigma-70 family)
MQHNAEQVKAFTQLIQQYERLVYKVCNVYAPDAEDVKDLFQEIVLQAWLAYPRFRQDAHGSTWLYRIALNTAISHKRKTGKAVFVELPGFLEHRADEPATHGHAEGYTLLRQMIAGLPPLDKALVLLYLEDRSYQEMAEILGITASNAGTKLGRIKERLRKTAQQLLHN